VTTLSPNDSDQRTKSDAPRLLEVGSLGTDAVSVRREQIDTLTEGIKYAGSKLRILPHILEMAEGLPVASVMDGFSGSTRVSQMFARNGFRVVACDIADWSHCLGTAYLLNRCEPTHYSELIAHLNALSPVEGWFSENYGGHDFDGSSVQPDGLKRLWLFKNTMRLDAIREEIDRLNLDEISRSVALTSLILALDRVDSTLGHFASYLRDWAPRAFHDLTLRVPKLWPNEADHAVIQDDIFDAVDHPDAQCDLTYLDPPYGSNNEKMPPSRVRYQSYYHIWKTVILNDRPNLVGKARRRADVSDRIAVSQFEEFRLNPESGNHLATEAIGQLIAQTPSRFILLSYSSGGRATAAELDEIILANGNLLNVRAIDHKRNVQASLRWTNEWLRESQEPNREFLFLIEKG
jgi:adenine-specific DNA-methyltransferase